MIRLVPMTPRLWGERGRRRAIKLGIDPARLPPGQSPTTKFPILTVGPKPDVPLAGWALSVHGEADAPRRRVQRCCEQVLRHGMERLDGVLTCWPSARTLRSSTRRARWNLRTRAATFGVSLAAQYLVFNARVAADGRPIRPAGDRRTARARSTLGR